MRRVVAIALVSLGACAFEPSGPGEPSPIEPDEPDGPANVDAGDEPTTTPPPTTTIVECRVEGANLGLVGLVVEVPGQGAYRFESWQDDGDGEWIGFAISGPIDVRYQVRADEERFWGETMAWTYPGPDPDGITRIDFCATPDDD
jgi:hypothetical protein